MADFTLEKYRELCRALDTSKFFTVGSEISTDFREIIGLFLNKEIKVRRFEEAIDEISAQDGIIVLPHPYRRKKFSSKQLLRRVGIIEGLKGRTSQRMNLTAQKLAKELGKSMIVGSDAHFLFELGRAWNAVKYISNCNEQDLKKKSLSEDIVTCRKAIHPLLQK